MASTPTPVSSLRQFPCSQCGANLQYVPGTHTLACEHCGNTVAIPPGPGAVEELDFDAYANGLPDGDGATREVLAVRCAACGAETELAEGVTAGRCPFCGTPVVAQARSKRVIQPRAVLPFTVTRAQAVAAYKDWIAKLWFAPSALARQAQQSGIDGVYVPAWTYDSDTTTHYTGERGEDYQETETYTELVDGKPEARTRTVTRTRWWPARGTVSNAFDDLLVLAATSLPPKQAERLEPWDLPALTPYMDEYLAGFSCESYQVDLRQGFEQAKGLMDGPIRRSINRDIGGDHQRIHSMETEFANVTFKHILLPIWISAYLFGSRTFRFLVNARTGEVQGERPYSAAKIVALIATILAVVAAVVLIANR